MRHLRAIALLLAILHLFREGVSQADGRWLRTVMLSLPPSAHSTGAAPAAVRPAVLQTAAAQVGLCPVTCDDVRKLDLRLCCAPHMSHTSAIGLETGLSAWEVDRSWRVTLLTSRPRGPLLPVIDRSLPCLIARQLHDDLLPVTARTSQGMARVRSGQAPAWPLSSDRSARSGLRRQA